MKHIWWREKNKKEERRVGDKQRAKQDENKKTRWQPGWGDKSVANVELLR